MKRFIWKRSMTGQGGKRALAQLHSTVAMSVARRMHQEHYLARQQEASTVLKAAWIGFGGSILGACIAGAIAVAALYPALKQTEAAQRAAAVSAGQILRTRLKAANDEMKILLQGARLNVAPLVLALDPEDVGRSAWLSRHPERASLIKDVFIPYLDSLVEELLDANAAVELPDLERATYVSAALNFRDILHTTLDGKNRENSSFGNVLTDDDWRRHVNAAAKFSRRDWVRARSVYSNRINTAQNILRAQIIEADQLAMGKDSALLFRYSQQVGIPMDDDWPEPSTDSSQSRPSLQ